MTTAALDTLIAAHEALIAALDGGDAGAVERANQGVLSALVQVRASAAWRETPELKEKLHHALKLGEAGRVRAGYLGDQARRRASVLLSLRGRAPVGYGRNGRYLSAV